MQFLLMLCLVAATVLAEDTVSTTDPQIGIDLDTVNDDIQDVPDINDGMSDDDVDDDLGGTDTAVESRTGSRNSKGSSRFLSPGGVNALLGIGSQLAGGVLGALTGGRPVIGGYGNRPIVGGFGNRPVVGGFGNRPVIGGFGNRPVVGGFGNRPVIGGFGNRPVVGGFGNHHYGSQHHGVNYGHGQGLHHGFGTGINPGFGGGFPVGVGHHGYGYGR